MGTGNCESGLGIGRCEERSIAAYKESEGMQTRYANYVIGRFDRCPHSTRLSAVHARACRSATTYISQPISHQIRHDHDIMSDTCTVANQYTTRSIRSTISPEKFTNERVITIRRGQVPKVLAISTLLTVAKLAGSLPTPSRRTRNPRDGPRLETDHTTALDPTARQDLSQSGILERLNPSWRFRNV